MDIGLYPLLSVRPPSNPSDSEDMARSPISDGEIAVGVQLVQEECFQPDIQTEENPKEDCPGNVGSGKELLPTTMPSGLMPPTIDSYQGISHPTPTRPDSFNNDLVMTSFVKGAKTWAGQQRRGIQYNIPDATSKLDHVDRASREPFHLSDRIPIPDEIEESILFVNSTPTDEVLQYWDDQLARLEVLISASAPCQAEWDGMIPDRIRPASGFIKTVALTELLHQYGMKGATWMQQFIFGFDIIGSFSQRNVFPVNPKAKEPAPLDVVWGGNEERFSSRARSTPTAHSGSLWSEALSQVAAGWLEPPRRLSRSGRFVDDPKTPINAVFRFPVVQPDKTRACDDLKYGLINTRTSDFTPITLPTWDHVSQLCSDISDSNTDWCFFKADHASAYKNLPLNPDHGNLCVVALQSPDGEWHGFFPLTLLFGASVAVHHYNLFSRIIAVLANKIFRLPAINYVDDFGCLLPKCLGQAGLRAFSSFCRMVGVRLKEKKTEIGREIVFLGLRGSFPCPDNGMELLISLPETKRVRWCKAVRSYLAKGSITHSELDSLTGKLSFSQTSVFGRMGRAMMQPLYRKLYAPYYDATISDSDRIVLEWWAELLLRIRPRSPITRKDYPDWIVYSDAVAITRIVECVVFRRCQYLRSGRIFTARHVRANRLWMDISSDTNLIYGLELVALFLTVADPDIPLSDSRIT